jgi:hypothetical protein
MTWAGEGASSGVMIYTQDGSPDSVAGNPNDVLIYGAGKPEFVPQSQLDSSAALAASTKSIFIWGNESVGGSTTVRYLNPGYAATLSPVTPMKFVLPSASGNFKNMIVYHNNPDGNGGDIVYTLRVDGVNTPLSVTIPSTAASGSNLIDAVSVTRPEVVDIEITKPGNIGNSPDRIVISMEYF